VATRITGFGHLERLAQWTGLDARALRVLLADPLHPTSGFVIPGRLAGSAEKFPARVVVRWLEQVAGPGVTRLEDGSLDEAALAALLGVVPGVQSRDGAGRLGVLHDIRELVEHAGLTTWRGSQACLTTTGRRFWRRLAEDSAAADGVIPQLLRGWIARSRRAGSNFDRELLAAWPLLVLMLHRFADRWLPAQFFAEALVDFRPKLLRWSGARDAQAAFSKVTDAFVSDYLVRFLGFFELVELQSDEAAEAVLGCVTRPELQLLFPLPPGLTLAPASLVLGEPSEPETNLASEALAELLGTVADHPPASLEELQATLTREIERRNQAPVVAFDGLSPAQMHRLLSDPFDPAGVLVFNEAPNPVGETAAWQVFTSIREALGEGGLRATPKGNLPRSVVDAAKARYVERGWGEQRAFFPEFVRNERDFIDLYAVRLAAQLSGLINLRQGKWRLSQAHDQIQRRFGDGGVFVALLRGFATKYAWDYMDRYPSADIVQRAWGFSLRMLLRHGGAWRSQRDYAELFLAAFPDAERELAQLMVAEGYDRMAPRDTCISIFRLRFFERFAALFGLVERRGDPSKPWFLREYDVKGSRLLTMLVTEVTPHGGSHADRRA
jgi:hypothetical protein